MLTPGIFIKSVLQGLVLFAASFGAYYTTLAGNEANAPVARAMGLAIIMISNLLLVQVIARNVILHFVRLLAWQKTS